MNGRVHMTRRLIAIPAIALSLATAAPAAAQRTPAIGGAELRVGVIFPERAVAGAAVMGEVDLGYFWRPELRVIAGLSHFRANIDREPGGDEGSFSATGIWLGGRYDLFVRRTTAGYARASMTLHAVNADAWDSDVDALLGGTNIGAAIALGVRRTLDDAGRLSGTFELRRTALNNIANTAVEIGVRMLRRGHTAYTRAQLAQAPGAPLYESAATAEAPLRSDSTRITAEPAPPDTADVTRAAELRRQEELAAVARADEERRQEREAAALEEHAAAAAVAADRASAADAMLRQGLTRAAAAMNSVANIRETDSAFVVALSGGAFASGAGTLSSRARGELRVLATVLAGYPGHIISVEGHTDAVGDPGANQTLSLERANAVRAALIVEGVDPLWTGVQGLGAEVPIASNATAAGRAANRRVEIHVMRTPCPSPPRPGANGGLVCPGGGP
jgi:outer membrane protein OmpA-like peptidoglycan-associated protein